MSRHRVPVDEHPYAPVFVTVIGDRWFGDASAALGEQALRLARGAGVDLMTARFTAADADARSRARI